MGKKFESEVTAAGIAGAFLAFGLLKKLVEIGVISSEEAVEAATEAAEMADASGQDNDNQLFEQAADLCRVMATQLRIPNDEDASPGAE